MSANLRKNTWSLNENYAEVQVGKIGYSDDSGANELYAWGRNNYGQLGQNNRINYSSPVQIPGTTWSQNFQVGGKSKPFTLAVKTNGTLWGWGRAEQGALGINATNDRSSPVQIPGTNWSTDKGKLDSCDYNGIAIKTDGSLYVWGKNNYGQMGNNTRNDGYSSPVQIPGTYSWTSISGGGETAAFVKTNGELWMVGHCGRYVSPFTVVGGGYSRSSPVQVPGTTWRSVHPDQDGQSALYTKTDGTMWYMGQYSSGLNGKAIPSSRYGDVYGNNGVSSPIQIGSDSTWTTKLAVFDNAACAIKTDGSLWTWGNNSRGRLGHSDKYAQDIFSPRQVGTDLTWESIGMGHYFTAATKQDGTIWVWGGLIDGLSGDNYEDDWERSRSSPTQIGSTGFGWSVGQQASQADIRAVKSVT